MTKLLFLEAGWSVIWHIGALLLNWWVLLLLLWILADVAFVWFFGSAARLGQSWDDEAQ